jgi:hypothetical protein
VKKNPDSSSIGMESPLTLPDQLGLLLAIVTATITNIALIFFPTSIITLISSWEWPNSLLWPQELYLAGFIGGIIGGSFAHFEIRSSLERNQDLKAGTLISSDLLYIFGVLGLIYVLEFLSESFLLLALFFTIVVIWFTVFARNVIKIIW